MKAITSRTRPGHSTRTASKIPETGRCVDPKTGIMGAKIKFNIKEQPSVDYYGGKMWSK